jgi:hypothetical protein
MKTHWIEAATCSVLLALLGGCRRTPSVSPEPPQPARPAVSLAEMQIADHTVAEEEAGFLRLPYVETSDDTYAGDPSLFLGKFLAVRRENDKCPDTFLSGTLEPLPARAIGLNVTAPSKPDIRRSILVDQKTAAEISVLSYLSASLTHDQVASVTVTDLRSQRIVDDEVYRRALRDAKKTFASYYSAKSICYLLIVEGVSHKAILTKSYVKLDTQGQGGFYGINVGGSYYSTSEDFEKIDRFGLSLAVLRRPTDKAGENEIVEKDRLTTAEQEMLSHFSKLEIRPASDAKDAQ